MLNITKNELQNNNVPKEVQKFITDDLKNYIIFKDGYIIEKKLTEEYQDLDIKDASEVDPGLYSNELFRRIETDEYKYNFEEANSGIVIHVKRNKVYTETLHVFYVQENGEYVNNTTIFLEENSEFKYFEYLINTSESSVNFVSNSFVGENARLTYVGLSRYTEKAMVAVTRNSFVERYGNSFYSIAEVNDSTITSKTNILLLDKYASGTSKTVAITNNEQEASFRQLVEHNAPDTEGYIENYGVANNNSTLVFEGVGKIHKNMKRSVARQSNKGIVLGAKSRLDANPLLLIDEFDVIASHGAAIGKMDEEQLYYLMSRGLTLKNAERLIISGFLSPVLKLLSTDELIEEFVVTVEQKTL